MFGVSQVPDDAESLKFREKRENGEILACPLLNLVMTITGDNAHHSRLASHTRTGIIAQKEQSLLLPQPDIMLGTAQLDGSNHPATVTQGSLMNRYDNLQHTSNVLSFENTQELSAKTALAVKLNTLIEQRGLSQTEAATITGMTQPKVSQVRNYKLKNISLERLMQALVSLDQNIEIVVQPASSAHAANITVAV